MRFFWSVCLLELLLPLFTFKALCSQVEIMPMTARKKIEAFNRRNHEGKKSTISHRMTQTKLERLKRSIERDPFEIWFFKDRFQSTEDQLKFSLLWSSGIVEQKNTTSRLKNVILRSLNGESINIAIMGGSISAGGGLGLDREDLRGLYYRVFADWWQKTVEPFTGSTVILHNLAVGGTSSNFFAFCYKTLLNPKTDMDIAFLEFTVNDYVQFRNSEFSMALPLEQLTREVLSERNSPSILFINFVQGQSKRPICNNLENHGQNQLAQTYGITAVTLRNFFCSTPSGGQKTYPTMFTSDGNHASMLAHAQVALMIINYARKTILEVLDSMVIYKSATITELPLPSKHSNNNLSDCSLSFRDLPKPVFARNWSKVFDKPRCFTQITPDGSKNSSFHPTLQVKEVGNFGFQVVQRVFINQPEKVNEHMIREFDSQKLRADAYGGWKAQSANSILELQISIPLTPISPITKHCILKDEHIELNGTRNVAIAIRTDNNGGTARVWLDEFEEKGALINTSSLFGHTKLHTIAHHVTPGRHVLSVRTETPGVFILAGVMIGPVYK